MATQDNLSTVEPCPLHAAAPDLLRALEAGIAYCDELLRVASLGRQWAESPGLDTLFEAFEPRARAAIEKAREKHDVVA